MKNSNVDLFYEERGIILRLRVFMQRPVVARAHEEVLFKQIAEIVRIAVAHALGNIAGPQGAW